MPAYADLPNSACAGRSALNATEGREAPRSRTLHSADGEPDRIRSHVQLCWLALLLVHVAENVTGDTWRNLRHELDRMHLVTLATADGRVAQRSAATPGQQTILRALDLREPPKFFDFTPPAD